MSESVRSIGVLTSGGDAPGMNAAVRAVVRTAIKNNMRVFGIRQGYKGLLDRDMVELNLTNVSDIIQCGGTFLYTARCLAFKQEDSLQKAVDICKKSGIGGLVVIGGDGSFRGARDLSIRGIPCIGIPGTIDNDIYSSDYTIGFDTTLNTVIEMADRLRDTCESHNRCSVIEVMGNRSGNIALYAGIACGATAILVPERPFDLDKDIIEKINFALKTGKQHFLVLKAEGVDYDSFELAKYIQSKTGVETRATVLGHVQRGGRPTVRDRVVASCMGYHAVQLLKQGIGNRVVVVRNDKIIDLDILEALNMTKPFDDELMTIAETLAL